MSQFPQAQSEKKRILLIDDDLLFLRSVQITLELCGFTVVLASSGSEGMHLAETCSPDIILCDVQMPGMDGFRVLSELSDKAATRGIPFIYLTANYTREDFRKGMGLGADDYIPKPDNPSELISAIRMRMKKHLSEYIYSENDCC